MAEAKVQTARDFIRNSGYFSIGSDVDFENAELQELTEKLKMIGNTPANINGAKKAISNLIHSLEEHIKESYFGGPSHTAADVVKEYLTQAGKTAQAEIVGQIIAEQSAKPQQTAELAAGGNTPSTPAAQLQPTSR